MAKQVFPPPPDDEAPDSSSYASDEAVDAVLPTLGLGRRRLSRDEVSQRLSYAVFLLSRRAYTHQIVMLFSRRWKMSRGQTYRYLKEARRIMASRSRCDFTTARERSLVFWEGVVSDMNPETPLGLRMMAQREIDAIHGVRAPVKVEDATQRGQALDLLRQQALLSPEMCELMAQMAEKLGDLDCSVPEKQLKTVEGEVNGEANGKNGAPP